MTLRLRQVQDAITSFGHKYMVIQRPVREVHNKREQRNKLVVYLHKMKGWSFQDIAESFKSEWGEDYSRQNYINIYKRDSRKYPKRVFEGYMIPKNI